MTSAWTALALAPAAEAHPMSEKDLVLPLFKNVSFLGIDGWTLLAAGLVVCGLGLLFGYVVFNQLKKLPVHKSMREISELIYETCKTYLFTQGKFLAVLWALIALIMVV
jgi:K(+)-stimulated pyrophosphate-energized sodium pump